MAENTSVTLPSIQREFATSAGIGAVPSAVADTVVQSESGSGSWRTTRLTYTAVPITITDDGTNGAGGGVAVYTFPVGRIMFLGGVMSVAFTTTSALTSTFNASSTNGTSGLGSAAAVTALATTAINMIPGSGNTPISFTSSATINVAGVVTAAGGTATATAPAVVDGTATAATLYLNAGVTAAGNADHDANSTVTGTGYSVHHWVNLGDY